MLTYAEATYAEDYSLNADTRSRSTALTQQAKTEQKRRPERGEGSASMMLRLGTPLPLTLFCECFLFSLHPLSFCFLLFGVHATLQPAIFATACAHQCKQRDAFFSVFGVSFSWLVPFPE
jgi:hypothetical protein